MLWQTLAKGRTTLGDGHLAARIGGGRRSDGDDGHRHLGPGDGPPAVGAAALPSPAVLGDAGTDGRGAAVLAAVAGAVLAATAGLAPSGVEPADRLLAAAGGAGLAAAGGRAARWALLAPAAIGTALAGDGLGLACGLAALAAALGAGWTRRVDPRLDALAALAAALGAGALARLDAGRFHGDSALLAAAAAAPVVATAWPHLAPPARRAVRRAAGAATLVAVLAAAGAALTLLAARGDVTRGQRALDRAVEAARDGDDEAATAALDEATAAFEAASRSLDAWWGVPGRAVPVLGHNLRAVRTAADVAARVGTAGRDAVARAGDDVLRVRGGRVPVEAIADLAGPADRALAEVRDGERRALAADSPWLLPPVADRYARLVEELADVRPDLEVATEAVDALPDLLGAAGERRYLVLFVTPVEARPTGFPGNYAELVAADGVLDMVRFGRITDLEQATDPATRTLDLGEDFHTRYDRFRPTTYFRNLTATPDFPTVAEAWRQLYPQAGGAPIDGVLAVDPAGLAAILELTGPVAVPGFAEPFTADNVEVFLLRDQYVELPDQPDRIDALETIGRAVFERLTTGDLSGPADIADALAPAAHAGHLRVVTFDEPGRRFLERIGVTGALPDPEGGDVLAVTNVNAIGGKVDLFLERDVTYDVRWDPDTGEVAATVTVRLTNTTPSDAGLPDYVVANSLEGPGADLPVGTNRTWLSVFTPFALESATLGGDPVAVEEHAEGDLYAYSVLVDVAPDGGFAELRLDLSGRLAGDGYRLRVHPQLLAVPDRLEVRIEAGEPVDAEVEVGDPWGGPVVRDGRGVHGTFVVDGPVALWVR